MAVIQPDCKQIFEGNPEPDSSDLNLDDSMNIIEMLRVKTEEIDLNQYLKKGLGGYTKRSILEYLGKLRKQQQITAETFSRNLQVLRDEKEALKKANELLRSRLGAVENNYAQLSDSIRFFEYEDKDFSVEDVIGLKSKVSMLEDEAKKHLREMEKLNVQLDRQNVANLDLNTKLKQANQEIEAQKQLVIAEKLETKKQRDTVTDIYSQLEAQLNQNDYLNKLLLSGEQVQLKAKVADLMEQLTVLTNVNAKLVSDCDIKAQAIATFKNQLESVNLRANTMSLNLEGMKAENDKLFAANQALTDLLEEEYKKAIILVRERSNIMIEKISAINELNQATTKISIMEQLLDQDKKSDELSNIYRSMNNIEYEKQQTL
jgi:chromosome segregation ATPase